MNDLAGSLTSAIADLAAHRRVSSVDCDRVSVEAAADENEGASPGDLKIFLPHAVAAELATVSELAADLGELQVAATSKGGPRSVDDGFVILLSEGRAVGLLAELNDLHDIEQQS